MIRAAGCRGEREGTAIARKYFECEWFGIEFSRFAKLDPGAVADSQFYDGFYREFNKRYVSYDDLPAAWREDKAEIAAFILRHTRPEQRLLSIGCGNGYIEYLLVQAGRAVVAVEPSTQATALLRRSCAVPVYHGYFPEVLVDRDVKALDVAYMVATEYVFSDAELRRFLAAVHRSGIPTFLLVSVSVYNPYSPRELARRVAAAVRSWGVGAERQFWGYKRTRGELVRAVRDAGFHDIAHGYLGKAFWVRGRTA